MYLAILLYALKTGCRQLILRMRSSGCSAAEAWAGGRISGMAGERVNACGINIKRRGAPLCVKNGHKMGRLAGGGRRCDDGRERGKACLSLCGKGTKDASRL